MSIIFNEENRSFKLDTSRTSYIIGIADEGFVGHIYYGKKIRNQDASYMLRLGERPFAPSVNNRDRVSFMDTFPFEYAGNGAGDFRESAISVRTAGGHAVVTPMYVSYEILDEKPALPGLPSSFAGNDKVNTLVIHCTDEILGLNIDLLYSVFEKKDIITRSVNITNNGEPLYLTKVMSACIDMDADDYEMLTLSGAWGRERHMERRPVAYGKQSVGSIRGESSHQEHPFLAWLSKNADQTTGHVYAMNFVYSGNFLAQIEKSQFRQIRALMGINPENFTWYLDKGETFTAPEVVMTFSSEGLGLMSRNFHDFYRFHMMRSKYTHMKRPILINNWEGTYFDFNTEKLVAIAKEASKAGIEMLVMDDGWFGKRNDDNSSLGDWFVNEDKLSGGLKVLADEVNKLGMKFGIWMEPEMISPDSDLYRNHPDWAIQVPGRKGALSRNQCVLDIGRKEVRDTVYEMIYNVLKSANIEYVKWDMNRQLTDLGSFDLPADRQGELCHRYVLGVYDLQERLTSDFPDLLLENCSGGGARFDPGMLYYSPQIWCSDDIDVVERLSIHEGTSLVYPLSTMGAHIAVCPNHTVGRITPFETRGHVALTGTFGYELDVTKLSKEELDMIPKQVEMYHKYNDLIREGDYYRLASYRENHIYDCYMVISKDKKEALVNFVQVLAEPNFKSRRIKLQGLDADKDYKVEMEEVLSSDHSITIPGLENVIKVYSPDGCTFGGDLLMEAGLPIMSIQGDFMSRLFHLRAD